MRNTGVRKMGMGFENVLHHKEIKNFQIINDLKQTAMSRTLSSSVSWDYFLKELKQPRYLELF